MTIYLTQTVPNTMLDLFHTLSGILLSNLQGENYLCFIDEKAVAQRV